MFEFIKLFLENVAKLDEVFVSKMTHMCYFANFISFYFAPQICNYGF